MRINGRPIKSILACVVGLVGVLMLLFAFSLNTYAAERSGSCGENLSWELDDNGTLSISGSGKMDDYDNYGKVPWSSIQANIKKVVISEGVTSIGDHAFYGCPWLTEVSLPESMTIIGEHALCSCHNLDNINIPENVTTIGKYSFYSCGKLINITIPKSVISIGDSAFELCSNLESVTLQYGLQSIGGSAFYSCSNLTSIHIPSSVTSIGNYAFLSCSSLNKVYIDDLQSYLAIEYGNSSAHPIYYSAELYIGDELLENLVVPEGVTDINDEAFKNCVSLKSVVIPEGVTSIGKEAFYYCKNLKSITIPASVTTIGSKAFDQIDSDYTVYTPKDSYASTKFSSSHVVIRCSTHQWDTEYTIDEEASCTVDGSRSIHCLTCGMIKDDSVEVIPAKGHTFDQEIPDQKYLKTEGNCVTNPAVYYKSCLCGERGEDTFEYVEHKWNENYTVDKKATCVATGIESIHCSVCNAVKDGSQRTIPKIETIFGDHIWNERLVRKATLFKPGLEEYECACCNELKRQEFNWSLDKPDSYSCVGYNVIGHTAIFKNSKSATVRLQNPIKGSVVKLKIGNKTYKKKVKNSAKIKFKIKKPKYGKKVTIRVYYKGKLIGKNYIDYGAYEPEDDIVYYAKNIKKGMTKKQVKCLYNWGDPVRTAKKAGGWTFWYYGNSYVVFKNGKVVDWYSS